MDIYLNKLYNNKNFSDIKLIIRDDEEDITIFASKAILSMNCIFFLNIFNGTYNDYDSNDDYFIMNVENAKMFNEVIKVLYHIDIDLNNNNVFEYLEIANKYDIEIIKDYFIVHIRNEIKMYGETLDRILDMNEEYNIFAHKLDMYEFIFILTGRNKLIYEEDKLKEMIDKDLADLEEKKRISELSPDEYKLLNLFQCYEGEGQLNYSYYLDF